MPRRRAAPATDRARPQATAPARGSPARGSGLSPSSSSASRIPVRGARWFSKWVNYLQLWRFTDIIDEQTRSMTVYAIVQNKQPGTRMNCMVKISFEANINGKFKAKKKMNHKLKLKKILEEEWILLQK